MHLGDKHTIDGKEYVAVYECTDECLRCAFEQQSINCAIASQDYGCDIYEQDRWQQIVWIEINTKKTCDNCLYVVHTPDKCLYPPYKRRECLNNEYHHWIKEK